MSIDSGYHISLARWYAAQGGAWWDHINFGPGGRPNLQRPALHIAIAAAVRASGNDPFKSAELRKASDRLFDDYFGSDA